MKILDIWTAAVGGNPYENVSNGEIKLECTIATIEVETIGPRSARGDWLRPWHHIIFDCDEDNEHIPKKTLWDRGVRFEVSIISIGRTVNYHAALVLKKIGPSRYRRVGAVIPETYGGTTILLLSSLFAHSGKTEIVTIV